MSESGQVKTWRVLHDGLKVGHSLRYFGSFLPEAAMWDGQILRSYLNSGQLEEIFVDQSVLDKWRKEQDKADALLAPVAPIDVAVPLKKVVKKKRVVKKTTTKKGVTNDRLVEENV